MSWRGLGAGVLAGHFAVWALIAIALEPGLDVFGDMHELYAWGQHFQWGTFKHPPLLAWIVGAWFAVMPTTDWAFKLLSVLNMTLAVALVGGFTREVLAWQRPAEDAEPWRVWAMAAAALSLAYGNLALKLNMNSVLLPLWPLAGWAFWRAMTRPGWMASVALGVAAALAMLGKYYSGVLLLSMLLAALACPTGRRWLLTRWPWISVAVCVVLLLPHLQWVARHGFATFRYVEEKGGGHSFGVRSIFSFLGMLLVFPLVAAVLLWWAGRPWRRLHGVSEWVAPLLVLAVAPAVLSVALAAFVDIRLSAPWGLPLGFVLPALVLSVARPAGGGEPEGPRLRNALLLYWAVALVVGVIYNGYEAYRGGATAYYLPRQELAQALQSVATEGAPDPGRASSAWTQQDRAPQWVGGDWRYATALAFYMPQHPDAVPGLPQQGVARLQTPVGWRGQRGLIVCARATDRSCLARATAWAAGQGLVSRAEEIVVHRAGWRFPLRVDQSFDVLWITPASMPATGVVSDAGGSHESR